MDDATARRLVWYLLPVVVAAVVAAAFTMAQHQHHLCSPCRWISALVFLTTTMTPFAVVGVLAELE